uniref:DNA-directed DNA polymerase n=1 Tax=Paulinella longichromatophora TaxID=1708747 RepID=A0A2H4ZPG2_9EUKA|nr:DNA polymerase, gamma and tau subunits [Paulinella longichromatophora]
MNQAYQPLHHKYRPQRFDQLVGQEAIATTLGNALLLNRIAPAYLFSGPRGTGKTSSARILARSLNCLDSDKATPTPCGRCDLCKSINRGNALDIVEIDAASNTGVESIRNLIDRSRFYPVQARWKVYIIDECHMLSTAAFNALLKTLEEPPLRVVFILATTSPQRVLQTILSRCQRFDFRYISFLTIKNHLQFIAHKEKISITTDALSIIVHRAQGSLRDAESLLDQLSLLPPPIEINAVSDLLGIIPEIELLEIIASLIALKPLTLLEACRSLLDRGREALSILQGVTSILRDMVLATVAPNKPELSSVSVESWSKLISLAKNVSLQELLEWQNQLKFSEINLRNSVQPRLWLEVIFLSLLTDSFLRTDYQYIQEVKLPPNVNVINKYGKISHSNPTLVQQSTINSLGLEVPTIINDVQDLSVLWNQILAVLTLSSTRMLLSQQATLIKVDLDQVTIKVSENWISMIRSRLPLLESAIQTVLNTPKELVLVSSYSTSRSHFTIGSKIELGKNYVPIPQLSLDCNKLIDQNPDSAEVSSINSERTIREPCSGSQSSNIIYQKEKDLNLKSLADFFNGEIIVD